MTGTRRRWRWMILVVLAAPLLAWVGYEYLICSPRVYARCTACLEGRPSFCDTAEDEERRGGEHDAEINAKSRAVDAVIFKACADDWKKGQFRECEARTPAKVRDCSAGTRRSSGPLLRLD
jgi:hypothetical protein